MTTNTGIVGNREVDLTSLKFTPSGSYNGDVLKTLIDQNPDAILIDTSGLIPFETRRTNEYQLGSNNRAPLEILIGAQEKGIPIFFLKEPLTEEPYQRKVKELEAVGVVELQAYQDKFWGIFRGLQRIIADGKKTGLGKQENKQQIAENIRAKAGRIFDSSDYHDKPEYINMMINPELKELADSLQRDVGSIVIDCGHIDNPGFAPTTADRFTVEEGAILLKYLRMIGHEDVKLSVLVNEMYLTEQFGKSEARKKIRQLRVNMKKGDHQIARQAYWHLLQGYGINERKDIATVFEGILAYQCRQDLDAYQRGEETFATSVVQTEEGVFTIEDAEDGTQVRWQVYSPNSAPVCRSISAKLNQVHNTTGAGAIIYLRNINDECGVRGGVFAGRRMYGLNQPVHVLFYAELDRQEVIPLRMQEL